MGVSVRKIYTFTAAGCGVLLLAGCAGMTENQATGTGVGAAGGAVAGAVIAHNAGVNPLVGAVIGGVAGGIIGNAIGTALDDYERQKLAEASRYAAAYAPTGERIAWSGEREAPPPKPMRSKKKTIASPPSPPPAPAPSNAEIASGWIIPKGDAYQAADGRTCRDLQQVAVKSGKTYEQNVTACQTASGWDIPKSG
jgi:surface antigen